MTVLYIILAVLVVILLAIKCFFWKEGNTRVILHADTHTPFAVEKMTDESLVLTSRVEFTNTGSQCATIVDCLLRTQLPYEQYDGIEVRGKAEREGEPREDDYFEAVLIQKKGDRNGEDKLNLFAKVRLTPRKGADLKTALAHMVDLPLDFIWMETGRTPWHYRKIRLVFTAEEIAKLADVQLVQD